jgi:hypothetical protein
MQWWQVRRALNVANGSTLAGRGIAAAGRASVEPGPRGLMLATGYRFGFPIANAFTVGNVVITAASRAWLGANPRTLRHEERHADQYACLGLPMIGLYVVAMGWSWLRCRNPFLHNAFEQLAGLEDGGYL